MSRPIHRHKHQYPVAQYLNIVANQWKRGSNDSPPKYVNGELFRFGGNIFLQRQLNLSISENDISHYRHNVVVVFILYFNIIYYRERSILLAVL